MASRWAWVKRGTNNPFVVDVISKAAEAAGDAAEGATEAAAEGAVDAAEAGADKAAAAAGEAGR